MDERARLAAFAFLAEQTRRHGEVLPRDVLAAGFQFEGQRVPLIGPQALMDLPLRITSVPPVEGKLRPYEDKFDPSGLLRYRYRGVDQWRRAQRWFA